jgi:Monoamine oxidase
MANTAIKYNNTYDVIIVGAGVAGIACARELLRRGYKDFLCLEAMSEPGGRVKFNRKFGDIGGMCLHLPSKFLTIENLDEEFLEAADLIRFARKNGFRFYRESNTPKFRLYRNGQRVKPALVNHAHSLINNAIKSNIAKINNKEAPADMSLQEALAGLLDDDICRSLIRTVYSSADTGLDAGDISFVDYCNTIPSNPGLFPEDGMGNLLKAYARPVKNHIALNKEVLRVEYENGLYKVEYLDTETKDQQVLFAKVLVITVSIGVLQHWIRDRKIELPEEKVRAINNIQMGYLNKNILVMDERFFTNNNIRNFTHINIRSNRLDRDASFLAAKMNGKYLLINFVGGEQSLLYEKQGTAYARRDSLRILASAFGSDVYTFCLDSYLSRWSQHKYFYGAYSNALKGNFSSRLELSKPLARRLYRAGEEVRYNDTGISYHTHITGALNSGFITANNVIRDLETEY